MRLIRREPITDRRTGLTKLEVVTIVVCLGLGTILMMQWIGGSSGAREAARRAQCKSQLKMLGLALHEHEQVHRSFPPGSTSRASWAAFLLPHIGQSPLDRRLGPREGTSAVADESNIDLFVCPANASASASDGGISYLASSGRQMPRETVDPVLRGVFRDESHDEKGRLRENDSDPSGPDYRGWLPDGKYFTYRDNTDGTSNTIALGETSRGGIRWAPPFGETNSTLGWVTGPGDGLKANAAVSTRSETFGALFSGNHAGGTQFALVDASVSFFNEKIDPEVFAGFLTIAGGEKQQVSMFSR